MPKIRARAIVELPPCACGLMSYFTGGKPSERLSQSVLLRTDQTASRLKGMSCWLLRRITSSW